MAKSITFKYSTGPIGWLSNFSNHPVVDEDGVVWPTSEHLYQALKFNDAEHRKQIRLAPTPKLAAQLGRTLPNMRPDWDTVKISVMERVLKLKLKTNPDLIAKLSATHDSELIELSNKDSFWGVLPNGDGHNQLGKLWMKIRNELRQNAP